MFRWLTSLGVVFLTGTFAIAQDVPDELGCAHAKAAAAKLNATGAPPPTWQDDFSTDTDVLHYKLDIELQPASAWLGGSNTMTVASRIADLNVFRFRLQNIFAISELRIGATPVAWSWVDGATVQVTLDRSYGVGEQFELYVAYSGFPQSGGLGSIRFRTRNGAPEVYTLSEPWYAYTWWPAKDDLQDKTTADLWFTVPNTMVVAANGLLQGVDTVPPNLKRYRWRTQYPTADYLYCIGATNFNTFSASWTPPGGLPAMPLEFFIYPEQDTQPHRDAWLSCEGMLTVFTTLYGTYPFVDEKYGMYEFGYGGGMEHQTMTGMGTFSTWVVAHELAHQWWGDNVTCGTWHDIWLNEGFATYSEALHAEFKQGSSGEPALHQYMANRRPSSVTGTVYCYDIGNVNRIFDYNLTYLKASWVLHMLRHVVGSNDFFAALAAYRAAYSGRSPITTEFQQIVETVSGRDLDWFFQEWVFQGGAPAYQFGWQTYTVDGIGYVELYVNQSQSGSYPTFTMPVDVVTTEAGTPRTHTVWNDARTENLLFRVDNPNVTALQFDPKPWILATSASQVTFVAGPPKIVTMSPAPGAAVQPAPAVLEVVFHKAVNAAPADFDLAGQRSGAVPFTLQYEAQRNAARLTPDAALASDTYTLTVRDTIRDTAANLQLDGELVRPDSPDPLPSGNGQPGGSAVATFWVLRHGDLNCDGTVDFGDINPFVLALTDPAGYAQQYPGCPILNGDVNADGRVDFSDINPFVALLTGP